MPTSCIFRGDGHIHIREGSNDIWYKVDDNYVKVIYCRDKILPESLKIESNTYFGDLKIDLDYREKCAREIVCISIMNFELYQIGKTSDNHGLVGAFHLFFTEQRVLRNLDIDKWNSSYIKIGL